MLQGLRSFAKTFRTYNELEQDEGRRLGIDARTRALIFRPGPKCPSLVAWSPDFVTSIACRSRAMARRKKNRRRGKLGPVAE